MDAPSSRPTDTAARPVARLAGTRAVQVAAVVAVVALAALVVFVVSPRPAWHGLFDLRVYRGAVLWWSDGKPLYAFLLGDTGYGFTYPTFAALCMLPMALMPQWMAALILVGGSVVAIVAIVAWLITPVARRHGWPRWFAVALAVPLVLALEPIRDTLGYGQVNMIVFALVLADVAALARGRPWAGVGIGLAAAVKLTPGLFVVYLLLTRRWRATGVAIGTFLGATLLAFALADGTSKTFWTQAVWETSRVGRLRSVANQSLLGLVARATPGEPAHAGLWAVLALAVGAAALWRAVRAFRAGDDLAGITLVGLTACVVSPISWTHHLYWIVPALVVLLDVAAGTSPAADAPQFLRARPGAARVLAGAVFLGVLVVFTVSLLWFGVPRPGTPARDHSGVLYGNLDVIVLLVLLAVLPVRRLSGSAEPFAARTTAPPRPAGSSPR